MELSQKERIILQIIDQNELPGLQIALAISDHTQGAWKPDVGSLYPIFHSLEKQEAVESRYGDLCPEECGGARCRLYKLTKAGISTLNTLDNTVSADHSQRKIISERVLTIF